MLYKFFKINRFRALKYQTYAEICKTFTRPLLITYSSAVTPNTKKIINARLSNMCPKYFYGSCVLLLYIFHMGALKICWTCVDMPLKRHVLTALQVIKTKIFILLLVTAKFYLRLKIRSLNRLHKRKKRQEVQLVNRNK